MSGAEMGRLLIAIGIGLIIIGAAVIAFSKFTNLGYLPGDIFINGKHGSFHFPIVSCIVISIILSAIINLFHR